MVPDYILQKDLGFFQNLQELQHLVHTILKRFEKRHGDLPEHDLVQLNKLLERIASIPNKNSGRKLEKPDADFKIPETGIWENHLIGRSSAMGQVYDLVVRAARSDLPVLIQGESGTGKELISRAIHEYSSRRDKRFFSENCAALPEALLETEIFGYTKGSFTGATRDKAGILELANGGTLFLDEIGDMSMRMQTKLLRALQEGEIRRVGGEETLKIDVRILSATNKILEECVQRGTFREDLYYRVNVCCIQVPPLRQRKEDIPPLVLHFLNEIAGRNPGTPKRVTQGALELLQKYHWPGNVRELKNTIERAIIMCDCESIDEKVLLNAASQLGPSDRAGISGVALKTGEQLLLEEALLLSSGDKTKAARNIGWSRPKLYRKMRQYGIPRHFGKVLE